MKPVKAEATPSRSHPGLARRLSLREKVLIRSAIRTNNNPSPEPEQAQVDVEAVQVVEETPVVEQKEELVQVVTPFRPTVPSSTAAVSVLLSSANERVLTGLLPFIFRPPILPRDCQSRQAKSLQDLAARTASSCCAPRERQHRILLAANRSLLLPRQV